jgi:hypothetical protein
LKESASSCGIFKGLEREREYVRKEKRGKKKKEKCEREKGKDGAALSIGDPPTFFFFSWLSASALMQHVRTSQNRSYNKKSPIMKRTDEL